MKGDSPKEDYWLQFRKIFDCVSPKDPEIHSSILQLIPSLDSLLHLIPSIVFIIDYSTMQYLYFNESIYDYAGGIAVNYLNEGVKFAISNLHPDDSELIITKVFPYIRLFLNKIPSEAYKDYKFSFNFRYRKMDETYQHFIQHSTYLPDQYGNLRYNFGMGSNLPNADKIKITLTIEKKGKNGSVFVESVNFAPQNVFTKRELEVLKLLYQGFSSIVIADKLCLSEHTVKNHRKKMLLKTGTANTAALISYAKEMGIM